MRIVVVYKEFSDYAREVTEWIDTFEKRSGQTVEQLDPESPDGEMFCSSRDITRYPTVAVVDNDGKTYEMWPGTPLPIIDEVMSYLTR